jgi:hypothetical protein
MDPKELKENFSTQLEKLDREIGQLRQALAQRQELAVKLQGAIEAMNLQLGESGGQGAEPEAVTEVMVEESEAPVAD